MQTAGAGARIAEKDVIEAGHLPVNLDGDALARLGVLCSREARETPAEAIDNGGGLAREDTAEGGGEKTGNAARGERHGRES